MEALLIALVSVLIAGGGLVAALAIRYFPAQARDLHKAVYDVNNDAKTSIIDLQTAQTEALSSMGDKIDVGLAAVNSRLGDGLGALDTKIGAGFARVDGRIDGLDKKIGDGLGALDTKIGAGFARIDGRIDGLDKKIGDGLRALDTKIDTSTARLDAKVDATNNRLVGLTETLAQLGGHVAALETRLGAVERDTEHAVRSMATAGEMLAAAGRPQR